MPFGKYRGVEIADLPDDYLSWLLSLGDGLREPLRGAVTAEGRRRKQPSTGVKALSEPVAAKVEAIARAGYRKLTYEYHPDRIGGDGEEMRMLNAAMEWLRGRLEEAARVGA